MKTTNLLLLLACMTIGCASGIFNEPAIVEQCYWLEEDEDFQKIQEIHHEEYLILLEKIEERIRNTPEELQIIKNLAEKCKTKKCNQGMLNTIMRILSGAGNNPNELVDESTTNDDKLTNEKKDETVE